MVTAAILIAVVSTLWGYEYGTGNQTEYILAVERVLDDRFLSQDFFTNTTTRFGPRSYFLLLVAALGTIASLPAVFFCLALASNVAISLVTALTARDLLRSDPAGVLASCMVMSLGGFSLGEATTLASPTLLNATLAMPWALATIWAGLRHRFLLCGALAGVASVIHPLVGFPAGAVVLGASTLMAVVHTLGGKARTPSPPLGRIFLAWLVLLAMVSLVLVPYAARTERIDTREFVRILAHFRAPHHYLPTSFPTGAYVDAAFFLSAALVSWYTVSRRLAPLRATRASVLAITGVVLLACLGGYFFVEVMPTRLWTSAQTFRLLFVVKWLGFIGVAGVIAGRLAMDTDPNRDIGAALPLLGVMSAETMFLTQMAEAIRTRDGAQRLAKRIGLGDLIAVAVIVGYLLVTTKGNALFLLLVALGLVAVSGAPSPWRVATPTVLASAISAALLVGPLAGRVVLPWPRFTLADLSHEAAGISAAVKENTPRDAVILTPPLFGMLRLFAERAIVADFKILPFADRDMQSWYRRIIDCYGTVSKRGFPAALEMDAHYRSITDRHLESISQKYGASFAVLYASTTTGYPVLAVRDKLKLVALSGKPHVGSLDGGAGVSQTPSGQVSPR